MIFEGRTWEAYEALRRCDPALHKKLCKLLQEMLRDNPAQGLGKPEPLKHTLSGLWSRRLSDKDRVIYTFDAQSVHILGIGGHYEE